MSEASSLLTSLFTPFRVVIFFFISGYLFFKKQLADITTPQSNQLQLNTYTSSLKHLMFRLGIPTIIFATLI
jgi:fucose 4-O-acetylase-like acetyltransferase